MSSRIYVVKNKQKVEYLVLANTAAQALKHIVTPEFTVGVASQLDIVRLVSKDINVLDATKDKVEADA